MKPWLPATAVRAECISLGEEAGLARSLATASVPVGLEAYAS